MHHADTGRPDRAEERAAGDRGRARTRQAHRRSADRGGGLGHMAHCHTPAVAALGIREDAVVLVGNPNVGKSAVFNALTGAYVDVSNFPGTTAEITKGSCEGTDVVDTPGIYGVSSFNEEETVARDVVLFADRIVNVVDAVHLERDLFLTLQLCLLYTS